MGQTNMAPHAEDQPVGLSSNGQAEPVNKGEAPQEPGIKEDTARGKQMEFPRPPKFEDKYEEREYQKGRLAAAFRIFGKYGFDEGVAGHITLRDPVRCRVQSHPQIRSYPRESRRQSD